MLLPILLSSGNWQKDTSDKAFSHNPADTLKANRLLNQGEQLYIGNEFAEAQLKFAAAYELWNNFDPCYYLQKASLLRKVGVCKYQLGQFQEAMKDYRASEALYLESGEKQYPGYAQVLNNMGIIYRLIGKIDSAKISYLKALQIRESQLPENHIDIGRSSYQLGYYYWSLGQHDEAYPLIERARKIFNQQEPFGENIYLAYCDELFGNIALHRGDLETAFNYYQQTLNFRKKYGDEIQSAVAHTYDNLGNVCFYRGQGQEAVEYFEKGLEIRQELMPPTHPEIGNSYFNLGSAYTLMKDHKNAIENNEKARAIWELTYGPESPQVAIIENNIAANLLLQDENKKAKQYLDQALSKMQNSVDELLPNVGEIYQNFGEYYQRVDSLAQAIDAYDKGLARMRYPEAMSGRLELVKAPIVCIGILWEKAKTLKKFGALEASGEVYKEALNFIDQLNRSYAAEVSRKDMIDTSYPIYEDMLQLQMENGKENPKESFQLLEKSKALLFRAALQKEKALEFAGIPQEDIELEKSLKSQIGELEEKRFQLLTNSNSNKDSLLAMEKQVQDLKHTYEDLIDKFEQEFPNYYQLKYNNEVIGLEHLQKRILAKDQVLVEYFVGDSSIFVFVVQRGQTNLLEIEKNFPLDQLFEELRNSTLLQRGRKIGKERYRQNTEVFLNASAELYQRLFEPIDQLIPANSSVIIVPDGKLAYLPFEVLLTAKPEPGAGYRALPYLIKDHSISYAYSATLLEELRTKKHQSTKGNSFLGIAPTFRVQQEAMSGQRSQAITFKQEGPLMHNIAEVGRIASLFDGVVLTDSLATIEKFLEQAPHYPLLHLSTHARANDNFGDYSYLVFQDGANVEEDPFLYVRELYKMRLNAEMVVLSACEAGIGELQRGEGIISLARGFTYAGAKSIVTSLWSVEEKPTERLLHHFYQGIKKGLRKEKAMQQAKLAYLQSEPNPEPFFWASFVVIGDTSAVSFSRQFNWLWLGLLIPVLIFISLRVRKG